MWQRFTERARRIIFFAQEEAGQLGENYVSTEHILLGLTRENDCVAARVLERMGVSLDRIRAETQRHITKGDARSGQDMQLTPRAKRVIDLAYADARSLENNYIGTEHLLLGLVREGEGVAARVLGKLNVTHEAMLAVVRDMQGSGIKEETPRQPAGMLCERLRQTPLHGANLIDIASLTKEQVYTIFDWTAKLKEGEIHGDQQRDILRGKTLAMIFEKPSLRTRVSFEVGMFQLGGHAIYLAPADIGLGTRESIGDIARTLDRMCDVIMARVFEHQKVVDLARYSSVPVINGLSDLEHPCQALADFYTIMEKKKTVEGLKLAFIGDGNNVAHSLMLLAAKLKTDFAIACPEGYQPNQEIVSTAQGFAEDSGSAIETVSDPVQAVKDADVVVTDVWASMGQEDEAEERAKVFADYQVNTELMKHAKPDAIFEHCLPAHRGSEVTDEVIDSPQSVVFDEAENRLHVQKAIMALVGG